ncbi:YokU family protein [Neobacillus sedimentimangrovi]|uniref:YokU family protein n=1 Tax=Neobacillus sedimentimangrovi TaxID=2699460 RepID=A0ABS8QHZ1_9BACI|nr:YokU family protein [Neobacillus sedimentimangrovi]MCD4838826.1 YokU family protein [Neobacillus sedimentimangrovi]
MLCDWCGNTNAQNHSCSVYWELPDGTRAIEITETPSISCPDCSMVYQKEELVKEIEDQLFLIDCKSIEKVISFQELMNKPRLLKRNYFDFSTE